MFWSFRHRTRIWESVISLVVIAAFSVVAFWVGGWRIGLVVSGVSFVLLGGIQSVWHLVNAKTSEKMHRNADRKFVSDSIEKSEDNPTIR